MNENIQIYENENKKFKFIIENTGDWPIHDIIISFYGYKREDYKVILDEIKLNKEDNKINKIRDNNLGEISDKITNNSETILAKNCMFNFTYEYLHKKSFKKLEFKISFSSDCRELNKNEIILNPYILNFFNLETIKLISLTNLKVIPVLSNNIIQEIILNDKSKFIKFLLI